jgi:hypothetical protein
MRSSSRKLSAALIALVVSTGVLADPVLAMDREGTPRGRENPIVRVIRQVKHFIAGALEEISIPHP